MLCSPNIAAHNLAYAVFEELVTRPVRRNLGWVRELFRSEESKEREMRSLEDDVLRLFPNLGSDVFEEASDGTKRVKTFGSRIFDEGTTSSPTSLGSRILQIEAARTALTKLLPQEREEIKILKRWQPYAQRLEAERDALSLVLQDLREMIELWRPWQSYGQELEVENDALKICSQDVVRGQNIYLPQRTEKPQVCDANPTIIIAQRRKERTKQTQSREVVSESQQESPQPIEETENLESTIHVRDSKQRETHPLRLWPHYSPIHLYDAVTRTLYERNDLFKQLQELRKEIEIRRRWVPYAKGLEAEVAILKREINNAQKDIKIWETWLPHAYQLEQQTTQWRTMIAATIDKNKRAAEEQKEKARLEKKAREKMADDAAFYERAQEEGLVHTVAEMTGIQQKLETAQEGQARAQHLEKDLQILRRTNEDQTKGLAKIPDLEQKVKDMKQEKNELKADAQNKEEERDGWERIAVQWQTYVQNNEGQYHRGKGMRKPPRTPEEERCEQERQRRIVEERAENERKRERKQAEAQERRRQEQERRDAEARERWKEGALREVSTKGDRARDLENAITNLQSRLLHLEYGRGRRNEDKIARLRDQLQDKETRRQRLNDEIRRLENGLYG